MNWFIIISISISISILKVVLILFPTNDICLRNSQFSTQIFIFFSIL
jgi:hypothetical protein